MVLRVLACLSLVACSLLSLAQTTTPKRTEFKAQKVGEGSFNHPRSFEPSMQSMEMPKPHSGTTRAHLQELKKEVRKMFPLGGRADKGPNTTHRIASFAMPIR